MDIKMFFEFPGILILIGIILLILSIVVGLLAYRKVDKEEIVFSINEEDDKVLEEITNENNEVTIIDEPNLVESNMFDKDEIIKELEQTNKLDVIEEIKEEPVTLEKLPKIDNEVKIYGGNNPKRNIEIKEKEVINEKQDEIEVL